MYIEERAGTCACSVHVATELLKNLLRKDSHHEMVLATMGKDAQIPATIYGSGLWGRNAKPLLAETDGF